MIDTDKLMLDAIRDGIREGIKDKFTRGYNSPLDTVVNESIKANTDKFRKLLESAIAGCLDDAQFTEDIASAVRQSLAKTLVQRFGGELEKQINALKSDPLTRARIVMALDEIVKSQTK